MAELYADFMKFLEAQDAARVAERADKLRQMQEMLLAALEEEETQKQQNAQVILVRMSNEDIVHWTRQPAEAMVVKNKKKLVPKCVVLLERINTPSEEEIVKNQENSGTKSCNVWLKKSAAKKMSS